ncbi:response regulator, partial [uncultured Parasutterella sp.]
MDIQMPEMNGLEATRKIRQLDRKDAKEIPIVAMTANAFSEDVSISLEAGMNDHISKPLELKRLYQVLGKYLGTDPKNKE